MDQGSGINLIPEIHQTPSGTNTTIAVHGTAVGLASNSRPAVPQMLVRTRLARAASASVPPHARDLPMAASSSPPPSPKKATRGLISCTPTSSNAPAGQGQGGTAPPGQRAHLPDSRLLCTSPTSLRVDYLGWRPLRASASAACGCRRSAQNANTPASHGPSPSAHHAVPSCAQGVPASSVPSRTARDRARRQRRKRTMRSMWHEI